MKIINLLFILLSVVAGCSISNELNVSHLNVETTIDTVHLEITYVQYVPHKIEGLKLKGYDVQDVYELDSIIVLTAYSDGNLGIASNPNDWGDRLMLMRGDSILFQSKPVGDPYQFEPFFYRNDMNNRVIIVCQLGNEENYGGEAYLLENGSFEFIGEINLENPNETANNTGLIEILIISENKHAIFFRFDSESLIDLTKNEWQEVKNNNIHYVYKDNKFTLKGL